MQCEKCGRQLADDATFCTSCGWKTDKWEKEAKKSKTLQNSNIAILIIGSIATAILFLLFLISI